MTENAKDEFHKIYQEILEPFLQPYEDERIAIDKKSKELKKYTKRKSNRFYSLMKMSA